MEIRTMRYFLEVTRNETLQQAADKLYVTPQALSKSIRLLEEEIGSPLFLRENNRLLITDLGKQVQKEFTTLLKEYDSMSQRIRQTANQASGHLKIGYSTGTDQLLGEKCFSAFLKEYPQYSIEFIDAPDTIIDEWLAENKLDAALTIGPMQPEYEFSSIQMAEYSLNALMSNNNLLSEKASITIDDIEHYPVILPSRLKKATIMFEEFLKENKINTSVTYISDTATLEYTLRNQECISIGVSGLNPITADTPYISRPFDFHIPWTIYFCCRRTHHTSTVIHDLYSFMNTYKKAR